MGGQNMGGSNSNQIQYFTMSSTGNGTDYGDLDTNVTYSNSGASNGTRGLSGGGGYTGGHTAGQWSSGSTHGGGGGSYNQGSSTNNQAGGNSGSDGGTYAGAGYIKITKQ